MDESFSVKGEKAARDADWYLCKADASTTETERTWWAGFAKIAKSEVEHYASLSAQYEKDKA